MAFEILEKVFIIVITALVTSSLSYVTIVRSKIKALYSSQCSQLRIQILELSRQCLAKEYVTYEELDALNKAYQDYHALGGNGTITKIYEDVSDLPLKSSR